MKKSKLIIVDDHQLFRNGIRFILGDVEDIEIVGEACDGKEFLELLNSIQPDVVLMDINMPVMNGIEATRKALQLFPRLNILVLSMFGDDEYYNTMIDIGVKGFILKDADNNELITAIHRIIEGHTYFSQELLLNLIKHKPTDKETVQITPREQEVLGLICKGYSTQEISDDLTISLRTVERHRSNLLLKTDSNNSIKLVIYAIKHNMVKI